VPSARGNFMDQRWRSRNSRLLWGMILLAAAYGTFHGYLHMLTGTNLLEGSLGVLLGLYICSHPAANAVNLLFFERYAIHSILSGRSGAVWLALNLLVLLAGWFVIFIGVMRFATKAA
jgi:hypothetical protein